MGCHNSTRINRKSVVVDIGATLTLTRLDGNDKNNTDDDCEECGKKIVDQCSQGDFAAVAAAQTGYAANKRGADQRQNQKFEHPQEQFAHEGKIFDFILIEGRKASQNKSQRYS